MSTATAEAPQAAPPKKETREQTLERILRAMLPLGTYAYTDFKGRPAGDAYLEALRLFGTGTEDCPGPG